MQSTFAKYLTTVLTTSALLVGAQSVMAQDQAPAQPQTAPMEVDDQTVENFVGAYTEVQEIHNEYAERMQEVGDAEEATSLQQEAQEKMQEAVTKNDITVEEYQQIAQQIGQDEQLRSRIQEELESKSGS